MRGILDYSHYKTSAELRKLNRQNRRLLCKMPNPDKPKSLPLPDPNKVLTIYTDASWHGSGVYGWAYVVHHAGEFEEAWGRGSGAENNNDAELLAAISAIAEVCPPAGFCLVYDSTAIGDVASGKARIRTDNQAELKRLIDEFKPLMRWFPGHGGKTPKFLARCDLLAS